MPKDSWTVSALIWRASSKRLWSWKSLKANGCVRSKFSIASSLFIPIELLKDAEPFSASTWYFPSDRNLEFWKGTVVHTNSLLLLSLMWTNLSSPDSSRTVPVSDCRVVSFCSFRFLPLIYLITHVFIYLFIYFCPVSLVNRLQDTRRSYIRGSSRISQRLKSLQSVLTLGSCALCHISPRQLAVWALICQL